eukprot:SAG31_NODE_2528_length_5557_cov_10.897948_1_plen_539_part_00
MKAYDHIGSVLEAWRLVNMSSMRKKLDLQALEVAQQRDSSVKRRKELGQSTRAFKTFSPQEKLSGLGSLMKLYQDEVDSLTRRAKYSEAAFTSLYKAVSEAPDPVPHLEAAARSRDENASLREENSKLSSMVTEYKEQTASLQDQGAIIRQMKDKIRSLERQEQVHSREFTGSEAQEQEYNARLEEAALREKDLKKQLAVATAELLQVRQSHDTSQNRMFEIETRKGGAQRARDDETDLLAAELDRTHEKVAQLQMEIARLKSKAKGERGSPTSMKSTDSDDMLMAAKDAEIARLTKSIRALQTQHADAAFRCISLESSMKNVVSSKDSDIAALQQQIENLPSAAQFLNLQKQVGILEVLEGDGRSHRDSKLGHEGTEEFSVEKMLSRKVRQLEDRIAQLNMELHRARGSLSTAEDRAALLEKDCNKQRKLVQQLEMDLSHASDGSSGKPTGDIESGMSADLLQELMGGSLARNSFVKSAPSQEVTRTDEQHGNILSVVTGQRDRFKTKLMEVEVSPWLHILRGSSFSSLRVKQVLVL